MLASGTVVLRRARIHTLGPMGTVSALAVLDGRIVAAGSESDAWAAVGSDAPSVDLGGRDVLPGFTDAHVHWCGYALMQRQLNIEPNTSLQDVTRSVRAVASQIPEGDWIVGRGWDHTGWGRWPTATDLDAVAPRHPVALTRKDGHAMWLSSVAMIAAGIGDGTPDPPGGEIMRAEGSPTGVLKENAIRLAASAVPEPGPAERQAAMVDAWPEAWCRGLTGCHDMGFRDAALFRDLSTLRDSGELGIRVVWYLPEALLDEAIGLGLRSGMGDEWLRVGGLKVYLDGTLGSQTAHMLAPYEGTTTSTGLATMDAERFQALVDRAAHAGLATAAHAIGDAANRIALDGFDKALRRHADSDDPLLMRIEHVQLLDPDDVGRFAVSGVVASMQPVHMVADMDQADRWWGPRAKCAYAWQSIQRSGATLAFGSDAPIETLDVFAGVHAATTRQNERGEPGGGWRPEQAIGVVDALRAYTLGPALASGQERDLGTLDMGKLADLIVVDRCPMTEPPAELGQVGVLGTMIEGVWVWQSPQVDFAGPRPVG